MAIYLEMPHLDEQFPFRTLLNDGDILTTPHWHKEQEIIYVKKGTIRMGIGEEALEVAEGEFVLVAAGRVHYVLASPGSIRYVYQFNESFFRELIQEKYELQSLRNLFRSYPAHSRKWQKDVADSTRALLDFIYEEDQKREYAYTFAVKGYLYLMILELYRNQERSGGSIGGKDTAHQYPAESSAALEKLDVIFRYVEEHYTEPITLEEAAASVGFSTFYFTKFFKKNVGKTFVQFLNEYRIERAKWILLNEEIGAVELVERIGIGSTKTYYRLFKELTGMTPREYKKIMDSAAEDRVKEDNI